MIDEDYISVLSKEELNQSAMSLSISLPTENLLRKKEKEKLGKLFKSRESQPQLEVIRVIEGCSEVENENGRFMELENITDSSQLKELSQVISPNTDI